MIDRSRWKDLAWHTAILVLACGAAAAQTPPPKRDAGGVPAPTPALERGRAVYVLSSCHFCHGVDLTGAAMGSADLLHSPLVGQDENGNMIGLIVRAGLPNLQTAMPQYADYSDEQIADLAAYIHYLRQQGRYRELTQMKSSDPGDVASGEAYFAGQCGGCHSAGGDLAGIARKYDGETLRSRFLRPGPEPGTGGGSAGLAAHLRLLEQYSDSDVHNILAYLKTRK